MKYTSTKLIVSVMALIVLAAYNVVLFMVAGGDHGATFWLSYAFMMIAFLSSVLCGASLMSRKPIPRDWLLAYPFYKHCTIYVISELVVSIIFMAAEDSVAWQLAFVIQLIMLVIFSVLIGSCFMARSIIENVQKSVKINTAFMKNLRVDVDMIVAKLQEVQNPEVKKAFTELADQVRYSDPVSSDALTPYEEELKAQIDKANICITCNDNDGALECCKKAMLVLMERNQRCKLLK